jgi:hypothetical protein
VKLARTYLASTTFRDTLLKSREVGNLGCLDGVPDRRAWLADRLKVEPLPGDLVRIRVEGCRLGDALVILRGVLDQVAKKRDDSDRRAALAQKGEYDSHLNALRLLERQARGRISPDHIARAEEMMARFEFEANPLVVKRPPGRVGR